MSFNFSNNVDSYECTISKINITEQTIRFYHFVTIM